MMAVACTSRPSAARLGKEHPQGRGEPSPVLIRVRILTDAWALSAYRFCFSISDGNAPQPMCNLPDFHVLPPFKVVDLRTSDQGRVARPSEVPLVS